MKLNVFALALICALSVAPVFATTAPVSAEKKAETKKEAPRKEVKATETEVAAKDVEVTETTPAADAKAADACPSCK